MKRRDPDNYLVWLENRLDLTIEEMFSVYTVKDATSNTLFRGSLQQTIVFVEGFLAAAKLYSS